MTTEAKVWVPGAPPNWSNLRLHAMVRHAQMQEWKRLTWTLAHSARNEARWPLPVRCDPPAPRWVRFDLYRNRLLDQDNAWASIKPLLDGLCWPGDHPAGMGPLLVDDSPAWCEVWAVKQWRVMGAEKTAITVSLVDPREGALEGQHRQRLREASE